MLQFEFDQPVTYPLSQKKELSCNSLEMINCEKGHVTSHHVSHDRVDHRGADADLATIPLHSSRFSAFLRASLSVRPVHSLMLSSHLLFYCPLLLPPCTVPCKNALARPDAWQMCPYHIHKFAF